MFFALLAMTRVIHVFPGLGDMAVAINETIEKLEKSIDSELQVLEIKDIQIKGFLDGSAYIIYDLKKTNKK
jgi:hypothetical protein